jgi:hypothetical protein
MKPKPPEADPRPPLEIIAEIEALDVEIAKDTAALKQLLVESLYPTDPVDSLLEEMGLSLET